MSYKKMWVQVIQLIIDHDDGDGDETDNYHEDDNTEVCASLKNLFFQLVLLPVVGLGVRVNNHHNHCHHQ